MAENLSLEKGFVGNISFRRRIFTSYIKYRYMEMQLQSIEINLKVIQVLKSLNKMLENSIVSMYYSQ